MWSFFSRYKRSIKKHLTLCGRAFISGFEYRSEIIVWLLLDTTSTSMLILMWLSIYQGQASFNGYSLAAIVQYYLLGLIINGLTGSHFERRRVAEIRDGKIDHYLTRPLSYLAEITDVYLANKLFYFMLAAPMFLLTWFSIGHFFPSNNIDLSVLKVGQFVILLSYAFIVEFLIALIITLLGFWFEGAEGLEHFKWFTISLFSGWMIPLVMMPLWLRSIIEILPFQYMYARPIGILQGTATLSSTDILYTCSFIIILLLVTKVLWGKAQLRYSSAGG